MTSVSAGSWGFSRVSRCRGVLPMYVLVAGVRPGNRVFESRHRNHEAGSHSMLRMRRKHSSQRLALAPLDSLGREIQKVLELIKPIRELDGFAYDGYCGAAS